MRQWLEPISVTVPDALREAVGGHPLVAESLARRGLLDIVQAQRFLDPAVYQPASSYDLPDMGQAVSRLQQALEQRQRILVWGDFDVDGQTSTALLVSALRDLSGQVQYHVPNRFKEGHGIYLPTFKQLLDGGIDLVVTCDTGIAAHEAVDHAMGRGIDVIITDHHTLPETLPNAYAAINPMRLPEGHPLRELPGVGTAYKLIQALYGATSSEHLLDLVAMGIVADVMVQVDDTRYLLQQGLQVLRHQPRPGIRAMLERAEINPQDLTATDIAFSLAPRLNALGRLADANLAVELLITDDSALITERVNELEGLNQKRKYYTRQVYASAQQQIRDDESLLKYAALVIAGEGWHTGVVGIVASRLVEEYNRPTIVLSQDGERLRGSARSVQGANIVSAIGSQAQWLDGYGGHTMAAGLSMPADNLFAFRRGVSQAVRAMREEADIVPTLSIASILNFSEIDLALADDLARLAPFGNGNPPLVLATRNVRVKSRRTLGSRGDHIDLRLEDANGDQQRVMWWFGDLKQIPEGRFDLAYTVRANVFKGKREVMVEWVDARPVDGSDAVKTVSASPYTVIDYRQHSAPQTLLPAIRDQHDDLLIWSEGRMLEDGVHRYDLRPCSTLLVWTRPPDLLTWRTVLQLVQPQTLILFGLQPPITSAPDLIKMVAGLIKYAYQHKSGMIYLSEIATLTAQSDRTISAVLNWINARTTMRLRREEDDLYLIEMEQHRAATAVDPERLNLLMRETQAYYQHWYTQSF
ncbi:MAG: single-stranded-DNA-specific exonuclease RecJ [Anaerolineae bacterium]